MAIRKKTKEVEEVRHTPTKRRPVKLVKRSILGTILKIFLVLVILGGIGAAMYWQKMTIDDKQTELQSKIDELIRKADLLEDQQGELTGELKSSLEQQIEEAREELTQIQTKLAEEEIREKRKENRSYNAKSLCTDEPAVTDSGRTLLPINPKYSGLSFLGQLLTGADCGNDRFKTVWGVNEEGLYTLGSKVLLFSDTRPTSAMLDVFRSIGFRCMEDTLEENCKAWQLDQAVDPAALLSLKPHYESFKSDDCVNCD